MGRSQRARRKERGRQRMHPSPLARHPQNRWRRTGSGMGRPMATYAAQSPVFRRGSPSSQTPLVGSGRPARPLWINWIQRAGVTWSYASICNHAASRYRASNRAIILCNAAVRLWAGAQSLLKIWKPAGVARGVTMAAVLARRAPAAVAAVLVAVIVEASAVGLHPPPPPRGPLPPRP